MAGFKVAAAQYPLDWFENFSAYEDKMSRWVAQAAGEGARLLVFPEYGAMELTSLAGKEIAGDLKRSIAALQDEIASTVFWYQTEPHTSFPKLPSKDQLEVN